MELRFLFRQKGKMKNKIVVLGGSFNPPTVAHLKLINSREEEENQWDCLTNYF